MKKTLLLGTLLAFTFQSKAQEIYAVTGLQKGKIEFQDFRMIDGISNISGNILIDKNEKLAINGMAQAKTTINNRYIAAMASLDGKIFYIPMTQKILTIVDPEAKSTTTKSLTDSQIDFKNVETIYTRMTTSSDGFIYAINNIGSEFLKISANGEVQNLGQIPNLVDKFKSFGTDAKSFAGGDLVADTDGNLVLISAIGHSFKINPKTLNVDYLGKVKGLPENYTINGAAVTKEGSILLATSSDHGFYKMNLKELEAKFSHHYDAPIYDLASNYFLAHQVVNDLASGYTLYPTVVKNSHLNIVSKLNQSEKLDVTVWNINHKKVFSNNVTIQSIGEFKVDLKGSLQPGIYILKAVNQKGQEVINTKFTLVK